MLSVHLCLLYGFEARPLYTPANRAGKLSETVHSQCNDGRCLLSWVSPLIIFLPFAGFFVACSSQHRLCSPGRGSDMSKQTSPVAPGAAICLSDGRFTDSLTPRESIAEFLPRFEQQNRRTQDPTLYPNGISPLGDADNSLPSEVITTVIGQKHSLTPPTHTRLSNKFPTLHRGNATR